MSDYEPPAAEKPVESEPKTRRKSIKKLMKSVGIVILAFSLGLIHYGYVSYLFENDRNFSHLSEIEREMSFRTEMGFYYSYYKTIVQEQPFALGMTKLMNDQLVEYPNDVNALNRFNIHPEVLIGVLYRYLEPILNTTAHRQCHIVDRGKELTPVESCVGLGQPIMFYLEAVWILAGLNVAALFLQATALSESILGGLLAVLQYFTNHAESTRVQWAPNERENMATPFILLQLWLVSLQLRDKKRRTTLPLQVAILILNCICLLFWQFSQFIFLTQLAIFFVMEQLRIIDPKILCVLLHSHFCGLHMAVLLLQGNDMLKSSLYTSFFLVLSLYCLFISTLRMKIKNRMDFLIEFGLVVLRICVVVGLSVYLKKFLSDFFGTSDDSHIWDILRSKFTSFKSFHTLLYTCSAVFDFLPFSSLQRLWYSFLIPFVALSLMNVAKNSIINVFREDEEKFEIRMAKKRKNKEEKEKAKEENESNKDNATSDEDIDAVLPENDFPLWFVTSLTIDPAVFYNIAQMFVYGVMAGLVMRLKVLLVPQMCVVAAIKMNRSYYKLRDAHIKHLPYFWLISVLLVIQQFCFNIHEEISHVGQFSDPHQEKLLHWILSEGKGAVFAGSMPLLATILLVTRNAIVVHPHYEHAPARQRAYSVYKTYGRFTYEELYEELTKLQATHLVVETKYCYGKSSKGCTFLDIWDAEVGKSSKPSLCDTLLRGRASHFYPVYQDSKYAVYRIHDYSVRYMPRSFNT